MKFYVFFICFFILSLEITFSQTSDSVVYTKKVEFLRKLKSTKEYIYPIRFKNSNGFLDIPLGVYPEKEQIILKIDENIFVRFDGTGFIFQLTDLQDSIAKFNRIDRTVNFNYNIGSFHFISGKHMYNYGGYGFWKSNGLIRKYDPKSREWSVIKTNEEIPQQIFKINNPWFDLQKNILYLPYRVDIHAGLKENVYQYGKITPIAYTFNLKTGDWSAIGKPSDQTINTLKDATLFLSTYRGLMVLAFEELYLFDFINNRILKSNDNVFAQLYMRITDANAVYHLNKMLYTISRQTGRIDSVQLDLDAFQSIDKPIYEPIRNYTWAWIAGAIICIVAMTIVIKRWLDRKISSIKLSNPTSKNFKFEFSDIEKSLIDMLLEKSKSNQTATISEINYVLGVKDKNIGLQKKVRSEIFNSVNEKFKLISDWDEPLVQSIRSESDKRYFEYMIRKDMIKEAEKVLQS